MIDHIHDNEIKEAMYFERYRSPVQTETSKSLNEALDNIILKLERTNDETMRKRLKYLAKEITQELKIAYADMPNILQDEMEKVANISYTSLADSIATTMQIEATLAGIPKGAMKEIIDMKQLVILGNKAYTIEDMIMSQEFAHVSRFKQIINAGLAEGVAYSTISRRLREVNNKVKKNELEAITSTVISQARNNAKGVADKEFDDVIIGWEHNSTLDNKTTLLCASKDHVRYLKKNGWTYEKIKSKGFMPPLHFRCRSTLLRLTRFTDKIRSTLTRAENGDNQGQISATTSFKEWFSNQSSEFQKDYLGQSRYKLWKENRLSINSFVDVKSGHKYTLEEIENRLKKG